MANYPINSRPQARTRKRRHHPVPPLSMAAMLFVASLLCGCAGTFSYVPTAAAAGPSVSAVRWSFLWGIFDDEVGVKRSPDPAACASDPNRFECLRCHGNGLTNVTFHTNLAFEALSILTIGMVTPVTVSYQCSAPGAAATAAPAASE